MNEQSPAHFQSTSNIPRAEEVRQVLDRLLQLLAEEVARKLVHLEPSEQKPCKEDKNVLEKQQRRTS